MSTGERGIKVRILEKEFRIGCSPEHEAALKAAAEYLDKQMRHLRQSGRIVGAERIALMAALNITNELLTLRQSASLVEGDFLQRMTALHEKIDATLLETAVRK